jgi:ABC-2 type transport system permease protein
MQRRPDKLLIVAAAELRMATRSKGFIIGMMLVPVMMAAFIGFDSLSRKQKDREDRHFVVVDGTGVLFSGVAAMATEWNASRQRVDASAPEGPRMFPAAVVPQGRDIDAVRRELVARVKSKELKAFVEIPPDAIDGSARIRYFSDAATDTTLPRCIENAINREILNERFRRAAVDRTEVVRLTRQVPLTMLGLPAWDAQGNPREPEPVDRVRTQVVPFAVMALLLFVLLPSASALMNSVLEEKLSRTNEVMLGSVSPFEFMAGKLLGTVGVSLIVASVYLAAIYAIARNSGYADVVQPRLLASFVLYTILGELLFGAILLAIGAACTDFKDTQTLGMPVMMLMVLPVFMWPTIMSAPTGAFATIMSLVPTLTPFLMLSLTTMSPGPPMWQQAAGIVLTVATTVLVVWVAGRIFRVGLLAQGKSASIGEMIRWVRTG